MSWALEPESKILMFMYHVLYAIYHVPYILHQSLDTRKGSYVYVAFGAPTSSRHATVPGPGSYCKTSAAEHDTAYGIRLFHELGVLLVGVPVIDSYYFGVYTTALDFLKLPYFAWTQKVLAVGIQLRISP